MSMVHCLNCYFCCHKRVLMVTCGILCMYAFVETKIMFRVQNNTCILLSLKREQGSKYNFELCPNYLIHCTQSTSWYENLHESFNCNLSLRHLSGTWNCKIHFFTSWLKIELNFYKCTWLATRILINRTIWTHLFSLVFFFFPLAVQIFFVRIANNVVWAFVNYENALCWKLSNLQVHRTRCIEL
jgi:hypothetical protein